MAIRFSKRGVFFSLIAILMSTLFILLFSGASHVSLDERAKVAKYDLEYVNDFVGDLDSFVDTSASIATFLTLNDLSLMSPIPNATAAFISCFEDGTYLGVACNSSVNHSFFSVFNIFANKADEAYNVNMATSILHVFFEQTDAYHVTVDLLCEVDVSHLDASWIRFIDSTQDLSIVGITDPLTVGTSFQRPIAPNTPYLGAFDTSYPGYLIRSNYSLLRDFIDGEYYYIDTTSPSFIDMLEGNFPVDSSAYVFSPHGISSFVPDDVSYPGNRTSYLMWQFHENVDFDSEDLRRVNFTDINTNFSLPLVYIQADEGINAYAGSCPGGVDDELLNVTGCCNNVTGCDPSCAPNPPC